MSVSCLSKDITHFALSLGVEVNNNKEYCFYRTGGKGLQKDVYSLIVLICPQHRTASAVILVHILEPDELRRRRVRQHDGRVRGYSTEQQIYFEILALKKNRVLLRIYKTGGYRPSPPRMLKGRGGGLGRYTRFCRFNKKSYTFKDDGKSLLTP